MFRSQAGDPIRAVWLACGLIVALAGLGLSAQQVSSQATPASGSIAGRVIDATSNLPVDAARVSARLGRAQPQAVQTVSDGSFLLTGLAAGNISLSASRNGYVTGVYGMRAANGSSQIFDLAEAEHATGIVLKVWKAATLSGFVTDESGRPAARVEVTALPVGVIAGRVGVEAGRSVFTDQQGYYTIPGVAPARYVVTAFAGSTDPPVGRAGGGGARQQLEQYPRLFFPDALSASEGTVVELAPGEARNDVDFSFHTRPMVAVSGVVSGLPPGATVTRAELVRQSAVAGVWCNLSTASAPMSGGGFLFPRVPAGRYVVRVVEFPSTSGVLGVSGGTVVTQLALAGSLGLTRTGNMGVPLAPIVPGPTWWGESEVIVADSAARTTVSVALQKGARVRGTLAFDGAGAKPTPDGLLQSAIGVVAPDGRRLPSFQMARIERDSSFTTVGLPPGTYALIPLAGVQSLSGGAPTWPETWTSIRTTVAGEDQPGELIHLGADDLNVALTLSETPTLLSGVVTDGSGTPRPDASIYIFRSDRRLWTAGAPSREVRPNRRGAYRADLPPGEYYVVASANGPLLWMEAASLEKLSASAAVVRLTRGDKLVQDLVVR